MPLADVAHRVVVRRGSAVIVRHQRVAPTAQQVHRHPVVTAHVPQRPTGVLPPVHDVRVYPPGLQAALLLGDAVRHELSAKLAVVEFVGESGEDVGGAHVYAHVEVVAREGDVRRILLEEYRGDGAVLGIPTTGGGGAVVPEEDTIGVGGVQSQ